MMINDVKISGRICNIKRYNTASGKVITNFGLNFYNGKKDGKASYDFISCKCFNNVDIPDKTRVVVSGWLGVESWQRNGTEVKSLLLYAREVEKDITVGTLKPEIDETPLIEDDIPF